MLAWALQEETVHYLTARRRTGVCGLQAKLQAQGGVGFSTKRLLVLRP